MSFTRGMRRRGRGGRVDAREMIAAALLSDAGWVRPRWLEIQIERVRGAGPVGAAGVVGVAGVAGAVCAVGASQEATPDSGFLDSPLRNQATRNWTGIGSVASSRKAVVDPTGLVMPWPGSWSLDWWIGAEDRWHFPSREIAVRQSLLGHAPVIETAMRVPSGDAVHRAYVAAGAADGGGEMLVVEVDNRTRLPFAVAFAVRPYNPERLVPVRKILIRDGTTVEIDGRSSILLPRSPAGLAGATLSEGEVAARVIAGELVGELDELSCAEGFAQLAMVYPLAHGASVRVGIPLDPVRTRRGRNPPTVPWAAPPSDAVVRGWDAHVERGMRLDLPHGDVRDAVEANRRYLLLFHEGPSVAGGTFSAHRFRVGETARVLRALERYGFVEEAAEVLVALDQRQHFDGYFDDLSGRADSNGLVLAAYADHWRLTRDRSVLERVARPAALAARWIWRRHDDVPRRIRRDATLGGLVPPTPEAWRSGLPEYSFLDTVWSIRGLLDTAELLTATGNDHGARLCAEWAMRLRAAVERPRDANEGGGDRDRPNAPTGRGSPRDALAALMIGCEPARIFTAGDAAVTSILAELGEAPAVHGTKGEFLDPLLTLDVAAVELARGDRRALRRLRWVVETATTTYAWPSGIDRRTLAGCGGDGQDATVAATFLVLVRELLVREQPKWDGEEADGLLLCPMLPDAWWGQSVALQDAPTSFGRLSFALRWHGDRPAVLWELERHAGIGPVRLSAPGLDPCWFSLEARGEALLVPAPHPRAGGTPA